MTAEPKPSTSTRAKTRTNNAARKPRAARHPVDAGPSTAKAWQVGKRTLLESQKVLRQIDRLKKEAERIREKEKVGVIVRIQEAIAYYGLLPHELFGQGKRTAASHKTAAGAKKKRAGVPRYGDGQGNVWTGHGRWPKWFRDAIEAGASRESMELKR